MDTSGIRFVRVVWCDNANVIRGKAVHVNMLPHYVQHGVGITAAQQAIPVMFDAVVSETGLRPVGEIRLVPDWSTWKNLPYAPGHARVIGDMRFVDGPWSHCPRSFLKRMIDDCTQAGFAVQAALENEFFLLRPDGKGTAPADDTVFASTFAMDLHHAVIDEIADALLAQSIPVECYYPESGPGQHEISMRYSAALEAADRQIAFREAAHAVAARHGLKASFVPKIYEDKAGSGCHLHLSLWKGEQNLLPEPASAGGLTTIGKQFVAGLLQHLPALMAITTPSTNSYRRIRPHFWSGAFRCWGVDNREAAVRIPSDPAGGGAKQIEFKTMDASANPYLALGAVLAAGLDGIKRDLEPGDPISIDPGDLSDAERGSLAIDPLPQRLLESIDALSRDDVLRQAMGEDLHRSFLAVRRAEWEAMKDFDLAQEVELLLERY